MSEDVVETPFKEAADRVVEAHRQSADALKASVEKAKTEALARVTSLRTKPGQPTS